MRISSLGWSILIFISLLCASSLHAQCTWNSVYSNSWETVVADPYVIPGTTVGSTPHNYTAHTGTYSLYLNLLNATPVGGVFYDRPFTVCPGATYKLSVWLTTTFARNLCNENVIITDSSGIDTLAIATTGLMGVTVWQNVTQTFTAPNSVIHFKLVTNVGGTSYNSSGDDLSMDDLSLSVCQNTIHDTVSPCSAGNLQLNLYDSLSPSLSIAGAWAGVSALSNGSLGTFNTGINTSGTYSYTVPAAGICPSTQAQVLVRNNMQPSVFLGADSSICSPSFIISPIITGTSPLYNIWQDGSVGSTYVASTSGTYWLRDSNLCGVAVDTIRLTFISAPIAQSIGPLDTTICPGGLVSLGLSTVPPTDDTLTWQDGSHGVSYVASAAGHYTLQIRNQCGVMTDTSDVQIMTPPQTSTLGPKDTFFCSGTNLTLGPTPVPSGVTFLWQDSTTTSTYTATHAGLYVLQISNACFSRLDSITASIRTAPPPFVLPSNIGICQGGSITLLPNPIPNGDSLVWQNSTNHTDSLVVSAPGQYILTESNQCGSATDTSIVFLIPAPATFVLGPQDTSFCSGTNLLLGPTPIPSGVTFLWQDGSTAATYTATHTGLCIIRISNVCSSLSDSIMATAILPPASFMLGSNSALCAGTSITLRPSPSATPGDSLIWQDGATHTDSFVVSNPGQYMLTEINQCGRMSASETVSILPLPDISIAPIPSACDLDSILIKPVTNNVSTYLWSTGISDSAIYVQTSGTYSVTASNSCGTSNSSVAVNLHKSPTKPFYNQTIDSCSTAQVILDAKNTGSQYLWSNGSTSEAISVLDSGLFYVRISDSSGLCPILDTVTVIRHDCGGCKIAVPSAFSPNGDGKNDMFRPFFECNQDFYNMKIYDRWGELVYETYEVTVGWDGFYKSVAQPVGVYVYFIHYRNSGQEEKTITGNLTLLK